MTTVLSREQFRAQFGSSVEPFGKKRNKYNAKRTPAPDGSRTYDSAAEARYCERLRLLERSGEIFDLVLQPRYPLIVNGDLVATYVADCCFRDEHGQIRIQDIKGGRATRTAVYRLKKKLFESIYRGLRIEEVE